MAWRNMWRNKIRSLIIMGSVAIGLAAGLFVLSLYKGILEDRVRVVIDTEVSHLQIHHKRFREDYDAKFVIENPGRLNAWLKKDSLIKAFTSRTICQGMLATGTGSSGLQIVGIEPSEENIVSGLNARIIEGKGFGEEKRNQIVVGKKLADKMHLKLGTKVVLSFTDKERNILSAAFRVAGIYRTDNAPRDERLVYVRQSDLNKLMSMEGEFHEIAIILKHDRDIDEAKTSLQKILSSYQVETWKEISPETKLMIDTTDQYAHIFIIIIMFALSFGIINTMLMAVLERSREIGMLLAIGMNRMRVFYMILTETVFLTLTGTPFGILITWFVVRIYRQRGIDISSIGGMTMSEFGFSPIIYPAFPWEKMVSEMIIVIGAAMISSLIPAVKAIRLRPVEALQK